MTKAVDITNKVSQHLQELVLHCVHMERENSHLKAVIRIIASANTLDENGQPSSQLTQDQVDYIKKVCDEANVFQTLQKP